MGVLQRKIIFQDMKVSDNKGANVGPKIPAERIIKTALMIRQSSFSKLINKKFPNGKLTQF